MAAAIHIGIGGWDFDPWRGTFYPAGLAKTRQLEHLGTRLNATEVNATYYGSMSQATFAKWAKSVPEGFKFALKASRFCTNRKQLGEAAESIGKFCAQGFTELGDKLGPILWQLAPTKKFDADELRAFLMLLPTSRDGIALRHALEVRHESFRCREFVALARASQVAICFADHETYPEIADLTADFVYARLQQAREAEPAGYDAKALDRWAKVARGWAKGESPAGLDYVSDARGPATPREVFAFFISGDKVRNPAAAEALMERLK
ncbi:MAG TPA: DUF72 domain-containing protein [Allosphingosinicella sp.]|jgi:uncharacterized protein YecE (DUF72 family)|nr:DUF72 domain-containing protein [Allosphingosinicella sp.]